MKKKIMYIIGLLITILLLFIVSIQMIKSKHNFLIIKPNTISLFFLGSGSTTKEFGLKNHCSVTINGSYFGRNADDTFFPAGLRYSGFDVLQAPNTNEQDPNLQITLALQQGTKEIKIVNNGPQLLPQTGTLFFNAGPMLFSKGVINESITQNISHRNGKYPRTILIINHKKEVFFLLLFDKISLSEATGIIKKQKDFGENYDAINLDGGPSTSIYSNSYIFNEQEKLPIFFCLH